MIGLARDMKNIIEIRKIRVNQCPIKEKNMELSRRDFLKMFGAGAAVAGLTAWVVPQRHRQKPQSNP